MSNTESNFLVQDVEKTNPMKEWMVDYVGGKLNPKDSKITVEMIVECMAQEFPEFLLAVAEENWIRGYRQAITDVETGRAAHEKQLDANT